MLVVICGFPRSGTSYIHNLFANYSDKIYATKRGGKQDGVWSTNEPVVFGSFNCDYNLLIKPFLEFHKKLGRLDVVYKHPQAVLFAPFKNHNVKYIVCHRDRENWLEGALSYSPTVASVDINSQITWVKDKWGGKWDNPKNTNDRLLYLYDIFKENIDKVKKYNDAYFFNYHDPQNTLPSILKEFNLNVDLSNALKSWRPKHDKA